MRACVYGILSICRYSPSIFPAGFPRPRKIRVNLNSTRPRRRPPGTRSKRFRDLSLILNRFSLHQDGQSFACMIYRYKRQAKNPSAPKSVREAIRFARLDILDLYIVKL